MMGHSKPYKKPHGEKSMTVETIMSKRASTSQIGVYDAALATLFADSVSGKVAFVPHTELTQYQLGPVKPIARQSPQRAFTSEGPSTTELSHYPYEAKVTEQDTLSKTSNEQVQQDISQLRHPYAERLNKLEERLPRRKRKRRDIEDDLEGEYMNDLAKQQLKEDEQKAGRIQLKRPKNQHLRTDDKDNGIRDAGEQSPSGSVDTAMGDEENTSAEGIPQHESVVRSREDLDLEKSSRTVFLANVSTMAIKSKTAKKTLLDHLASFTSTLPRQDIKHGVESLRFRSTAFSSTSVPRKAAYAKKELMDTTTKSTNAYVVYTTQMAAREALKRLNGTMVLDRHLRVDSVAHPAKIDHRRCVFVGNLGFVDNTTTIDAVEDEKNNKRPRKAKEPADIEEGLWRQFEKVGRVESVRVVRDKTTRVGKGFAYVQFEVCLRMQSDQKHTINDELCRMRMPLRLHCSIMKRGSHRCCPALSGSPEQRISRRPAVTKISAQHYRAKMAQQETTSLKSPRECSR